jgi:hypothetical protein
VADIHAVKSSYLSDNLEAVCDIAARTGQTILIATAGLDLENRERVFKLWYTKQVDAMRSACPEFQTLLASDPAIAEEVEAGEADFGKIDAILSDIIHKRERREQQRRTQRKHALKNSVIANTHDSDGVFRSPGVLAVRTDGKMRLFNNEGNAKRWGAQAGHSCYTMTIERTSLKLRLGVD